MYIYLQKGFSSTKIYIFRIETMNLINIFKFRPTKDKEGIVEEKDSKTNMGSDFRRDNAESNRKRRIFKGLSRGEK